MTEEKFTRCPGCKTVFRVTTAQLALREGQVRCGHCRTIFDGTANLIRLAPAAAMPGHDPATGPLTVTLRHAHALEPVPAAAGSASLHAGRVTVDAGAKPPPPPAEPHVDYEQRFAWDRPQRRSRAALALYTAATIALLLLFAGQLVWHYRDVLSAHLPSTRPLLARMCGIGGCEIKPLRDIRWLSIDASDLQADPAHKGLLILTATLRNRAPYAVAFPHLELTLTDGQDTVVVRRALAPSEYLGGTQDAAAGIAGNGEVAVKLFVDASATQQSGYRVYLFYP